MALAAHLGWSKEHVPLHCAEAHHTVPQVTDQRSLDTDQWHYCTLNPGVRGPAIGQLSRVVLGTEPQGQLLAGPGL